MNDSRRIFKKADWLIIAAFLLAAVLILCLRPRGEGRFAVVEQNGKEVYACDLSAVDGVVTKEFGSVKITFSKEGAAFCGSDCPDKLCMAQGTINKSGQTAVCLPNRIVIIIKGEGGYDGFTG